MYIGSDLSGTLTNSGTISATATVTGNGDYAEAYGVRIGGDLSGNLINTSTGTISATATAAQNTSYSAYAYGVRIGGSLTGSLTNAGTIQATATDFEYSAYAYGVRVGSDLSGALTNSGTISATATVTGNGSYAQAFGLSIGNELSGTLTNSSTGTISATATTFGDWAYAYGVYVGGDLTGTVANSGTIKAIANGTGGTAAGVQLGGITSTGKLTNSGTISGTTTGNGSNDAYGYGAVINGAMAGEITNTATGSISATATAPDRWASAYGIQINNSLSGTIVNNGTISATLNAKSGSAYGLRWQADCCWSGGLTGSVTNTGTISAKATATQSSAYAYGLYGYNDLSGTLTNSGTISAVANAKTWASAYGVYAGWNNLSGTLTNSGSISAVVNAKSGSAYGIYANNITSTGTLTNSGTISAKATANTSYAYAYGVSIGSNIDGTLTNSGTISAQANAGTWATAAGIRVGSLSGTSTLTNSGTISGAASGGTGGYAYGVYIGTLDGTVNNSGTISATGTGAVLPANVYSVYAGGGTGTVDNLAGGLLDGQVSLGGTVNLNNAGTINTRQENSTVGGNYTQAATGLLKIGATSNTAYGKLTVTGTANLAAGTGITVNGASGNTLGAGTLSGVVTSGGLTFSSATVTDNLLAVNYAAVQNGNNLDLTATATGLTTVAAALGGSGGGGSTVGGVLDTLLADIDNQPAELRTFLNELTSATTQQGVADAVEKIKPLLAAGSTQTVIGSSQGSNGVVLARLENGQGRASGDKFFGDKHFWLKPFGSWADQSNRGGVTGYEARTAGIVAGMDGEIGADKRVGLAFGYARSKVDGNSSVAPQHADIDSYQLIAYGSRKLGPATDLNFQAGLGMHDNIGRRTINVGPGFQARSDYRSWSHNFGVGVAHTIKWSESTSFTPSLRADYTSVHNKGYAETGAGALNLNVNSNDTGKFIVAADGKITRALSGKTKLTANLGLGYDLINDRSSVTSAFAGAPTAAFSTQGIDSKPWLIRGGLGLVMRASERVEVNARYDVEGRSGFTNQTASVRVRWAF